MLETMGNTHIVKKQRDYIIYDEALNELARTTHHKIAEMLKLLFDKRGNEFELDS